MVGVEKILGVFDHVSLFQKTQPKLESANRLPFGVRPDINLHTGHGTVEGGTTPAEISAVGHLLYSRNIISIAAWIPCGWNDRRQDPAVAGGTAPRNSAQASLASELSA